MTKTNLTKLNLGCGFDYRSGWLNVDVDSSVSPDLVHDLYQPLPFKDKQFNYILTQDILEHFTKEDLHLVLTEIARVLKVGGVLEVRVPNLDDIFSRFSNDKETRNEFIYGTTAQTGVFGAHKIGFTKQFLIAKLLDHELVLQEISEVDTNFVALFTKKKIERSRKLIFINQTLSFGGSEVFMADLLGSLQEQGWKIKVYSNNSIFRKMLGEKGLRSQQIFTVVDIVGDWKGLIKGSVLWPFLLFEYFRIALRERDADIFITTGYIEKIFFTPLAKLFGMAICWIEFGPIQPLFVKFFGLPKLLFFMVKNLPEKIITSSYNSKQALLPTARISQAKTEVIPCGRDIDAKLAPESTDPQSKNLVVCVSRLEKGKGQDLLIKAFTKVKKQIPTAKLKIVGQGDFDQQLHKIIKKENLSGSVDLTGRVSDPLKIMAMSTVVVFPSVWAMEGFGLVTIEALSQGKPIVAFKTGPTPEIIEDGKTGILVKSGDIDELANEIIELLKSKPLRQKLGKNAVKKFNERYHIDLIATAYDTAFTQTINLKKAKSLLNKF